MDYNHGTGHGVGYVLNVHEGPNSFHWKQYPGRTAERVIEEGMVTTDEPGIYLAVSYTHLPDGDASRGVYMMNTDNDEEEES